MGALLQVYWMTSLQLCILLSFTLSVVGGAMASLVHLPGRSSSLGSMPGQEIVLCSWSRHFTLTVPLNLATAV